MTLDSPDMNGHHRGRWSTPSSHHGGGSHPNAFDQNHSRYRTLCGCHVRGCSLIIGILEMIALTAAVVGTSVAYFFALPTSKAPSSSTVWTMSHAELSLIGSVAAFTVGSIVIALMIYGLVRERPSFLLPHIAAQFTAVLGSASAIILFVFLAVSEADYGPIRAVKNRPPKIGGGDPHDQDTTESNLLETIYGATVIGLCALACAAEIYFVVVVYRAYIYFYAKREAAEKTPSSSIQMRSSMTTFPGHDSIAAERFLVQN